jgi:hypothetical protein
MMGFLPPLKFIFPLQLGHLPPHFAHALYFAARLSTTLIFCSDVFPGKQEFMGKIPECDL